MANTRSRKLIPVLETERLLLRGHGPRDFAACSALWADPLVTRYIGGRPLRPEEVWARLLRYAGHWSWLGFGYWAIEQKSTGLFVGELGFADYKREIEPSLDGMPEIGWILSPQAHGQGFATEAVRAVLDWGDTHFGPIPTVCLISPENRSSIRVAHKSGFTEWCRTTYHDNLTVLYRRDPPAAAPTA